MLNSLATILNDLGNAAETQGRHKSAKFFYHSATVVRPRWSSPWYNLGLQAKYQSNWEASLKFNERAATLNPDDEASWWNFGIAATALRDWERARKAWRGCGIDLEHGQLEVSTPPVTACVRLNPKVSGEVVWGTRIDPARIQVKNIPLPASNRRYLDVLLNDGSPAGTRKSGDHEYPVFDELAIWQPSKHCTFQSALHVPNSDSEMELHRLCAREDIGVEDWNTIRTLCAACSQGSPEPHACSTNGTHEYTKNYGFAATDREALVKALTVWAEADGDRNFSDPQLVLLAT